MVSGAHFEQVCAVSSTGAGRPARPPNEPLVRPVTVLGERDVRPRPEQGEQVYDLIVFGVSQALEVD